MAGKMEPTFKAFLSSMPNFRDFSVLVAELNAAIFFVTGGKKKTIIQTREFELNTQPSCAQTNALPPL